MYTREFIRYLYILYGAASAIISWAFEGANIVSGLAHILLEDSPPASVDIQWVSKA